MSQEITLKQAAERAYQVEIICSMLEYTPLKMDDLEISSIAGLLHRLSGNVVAWLIEDQAIRRKAS
ncbi:hypothetical protein [Pantoea sp. AS-PWVM4]|uniref:hypothetical protein n=1 Tax=Pantoea sp. AS-PWVM4 TaxID=1332069 RepID=UPI0005634DE5|nr:hypothetical protein [Pantoea sp. AS-PWVM4]